MTTWILCDIESVSTVLGAGVLHVLASTEDWNAKLTVTGPAISAALAPVVNGVDWLTSSPNDRAEPDVDRDRPGTPAVRFAWAVQHTVEIEIYDGSVWPRHSGRVRLDGQILDARASCID